jgi:hypothetical protein
MIKLNYKTEIRLTLVPRGNENQSEFAKRGEETREVFCKTIHHSIDGLKYHKSWTVVIHEDYHPDEAESTYKFYVNCDDPASRRILMDAIDKMSFIKISRKIEGSYLDH